MNSVGIDVSKGKSMVAALRPMGEVAMRPTEYLHTEVELERLAYAILALGEYGEIPRYENKIISSRWPKGATIPLMFRSIQAKRVQCKRTRQ